MKGVKFLWEDILISLYFDGPLSHGELQILCGRPGPEFSLILDKLYSLKLIEEVSVLENFDYSWIDSKLPEVKIEIDLFRDCRIAMEDIIGHNTHKREFELPGRTDPGVLPESTQFIWIACKNLMEE